MQVRTYVEWSNEVDVEVDAGEFLASLSDNLDDQKEMILRGLNLCGNFMQGITDSQIAALTIEQRVIIRAFLLTQAERYAEKET